MTVFAHTYKNAADAAESFNLNDEARYALVLHGADGSISTVDSIECPALNDETNAKSAAMFSVVDVDDSCDVYHYGEYCGTAEYIETKPGSYFSSQQLVFSEIC